MLIVRKAQIDSLADAAQERFVEEMVGHLAKFAPHHHRVIGDDGTREVVRLGIERAGGHGFNWRGPVRFYLELMFMLGSYFDTDPQLPTWASNVLGDQDADQLRRAEMLYEGTIEFLDQVSGPGHRNALDALSRLAQIAEQPPPVFGENFSYGLLRLMREVYPEKYDYVGEQPHRVLVERGTELADSYEIASHRGITLFCVLMFAIGHGFHKDPLYPWIARTLGDNRIDDPDKRAFRLESRARTYLNHVLKNLNVA